MNSLNVQGNYKGLYFQLSGPTEMVTAVSNFIRNLANMSGGLYKDTDVDSKVNHSKQSK